MRPLSYVRIAMHGAQAVRAAIAQEQWSTPRTARNYLESRTRRSLLDSPSEQLEVKIYTPLTFSLPSSDKNVPSLLDADVDVEMLYEDDSDSDSDSDSGDDDDLNALCANESILDVSIAEASVESQSIVTTSPSPDTSTTYTSPLAAVRLPSPIVMPSLPPVWPPRLPRLSSIPVYCLREYTKMELLGTPSLNQSCARGSLRGEAEGN